MSDNNQTKEVGKEVVVRAGKPITYQGKEYDLRRLMFALHCLQNGVNPLNETPLTSNKAGAS